MKHIDVDHLVHVINAAVERSQIETAEAAMNPSPDFKVRELLTAIGELQGDFLFIKQQLMEAEKKSQKKFWQKFH